jgi:aminoglycoside phosphotransferase (APT) family kinase protein
MTVTVNTVTVSSSAGPLEDQLLAVLQRATGSPSLDYAAPPSRLSGGFWAELVSFRLAGAPDGWSGPLVARVMPDGGIATKETAFQAEVAALGFPTPVVLASGGPDDGLGRAFMVMEHADGAPPLAGLDGGFGIVRQVPSLARRLPATLAGVLGRLHQLDPEPVRRRLAADGASGVEGMDGVLASLIASADALGRADLAGAGRWLDAHRPPPEPVVVCHGDMHPFNVLDDGHGGVTVLDWSAAVLAPAAYDLAFTSLVLAEPPLVVPERLRPAVGGAGRWLSRRFLDAYARERGRPIDVRSLEWHQGVVCLRALSEVAVWVAEGTVEARGGHPWMVAGPAFAARLSASTPQVVSAR